MIEVLDSSSCSSPPPPTPAAPNASTECLSERERVDCALSSIVKHYSDPIHTSTAITITCSTGSECLPGVVQHWLEQLTQTNEAPIVLHLLEGYLTHIRPTLLQRATATATTSVCVKATGIPVLKNYLLLVEHVVLLKVKDEESYLPDASSFHFLHAMASDITLLTKVCFTLQSKEADGAEDGITNKENKVTFKMVANNVLPIMIQLLTRAVNALTTSAQTTAAADAVRKCAIAMLAFGYPRMDPRQIVPSIETRLMILQQDRKCLYAPINMNEGAVPEYSGRHLNLGFHWTDDNFWNGLQLNGPWEGSGTERVVVEFWNCLHNRLTPDKITIHRLHVEIESGNQESNNVGKSIPPLSDIIRECLAYLSDQSNEQNALAMAIRAHFFGRDMTPLQEDRIVTTKSKTRLMLGREVSVDPEEEPYHLQSIVKPYLETTSRVHAAMHYILLLNDIQPEVLDEVLPIICELLDASASYHIGMGAAALIHLILLTSKTAKRQQAAQPFLNPSLDTFLFSKHSGTLLPVLNLACQTCREGPPLALLARAQSLLCEVASAATNSNSVFIKHRRKVTHDFLNILDKYRHKASDPDGLLWALLVGGIIPLLHQHATLTECTESVDALEVGRLGLQALLPIVRYSAGYRLEGLPPDKLNATRKLLGPSVIATAHLLVASYPIMPRHGGKIMSELIGLLGNLKRQGDFVTGQDGLLASLVKDAARMALIICGGRADDILRQIESSEGDYEPWLGDLAREIREHADSWKKQQERQAAGTPERL
jgi:hypothetical protein